MANRIAGETIKAFLKPILSTILLANAILMINVNRRVTPKKMAKKLTKDLSVLNSAFTYP